MREGSDFAKARQPRGSAENRASPRPGANPARPAPNETRCEPSESAKAAFALEPHVCRVCFSRLVSCATDNPLERRYECSNCGAHATGRDASVLCSCGIKLRRTTKTGRSGVTLIDAGIRCQPNPDPKPDFPSLFIAVDTGK